MTFEEYLKAIRDHWRTGCIVLVLCLTASSGLYFVLPRTFTASTQLYVSAQSTDSAQAAYQGAQLSEQRVASYTRLASSPRVTREVVDSLSLAQNPETLANSISASSSPDSVIIDISVSDRSAEQASKIANQVAEVLVRVVDQLE